MEKLSLDKKTVDSIVILARNCREINDYIKILQTVNTVEEQSVFEKTFARIESHFNELKKVKLELKYKK